MWSRKIAAIGVAALCGAGAAAVLPAAAASPDAPGAVQIAQCAPKKACNPCNPCAPKKACNPCNPCAPKKTTN